MLNTFGTGAHPTHTKKVKQPRRTAWAYPVRPPAGCRWTAWTAPPRRWPRPVGCACRRCEWPRTGTQTGSGWSEACWDSTRVDKKGNHLMFGINQNKHKWLKMNTFLFFYFFILLNSEYQLDKTMCEFSAYVAFNKATNRYKTRQGVNT